MRISRMEMDWAVIGGDPLVVKRYFIQRALPANKESKIIWRDALLDLNMEGHKIQDACIQHMKDLLSSEYYSPDVKLRVVERSATIETRVVASDEHESS